MSRNAIKIPDAEKLAEDVLKVYLNWKKKPIF